MLRIKKGFILRRMGNKYIAVTIGATNEEINGIIRLNETGKYIWDLMQEGIERKMLIQRMTDRFDGLDPKTAETDLEEFLESIKIAWVEN